MSVHSSESDPGLARKAEPSNAQRPVVPTTEARQGVTGHNVRYVLVISTVAIIVIFAALWFYYFR